MVSKYNECPFAIAARPPLVPSTPTEEMRMSKVDTKQLRRRKGCLAGEKLRSSQFPKTGHASTRIPYAIEFQWLTEGIHIHRY